MKRFNEGDRDPKRSYGILDIRKKLSEALKNRSRNKTAIIDLCDKILSIHKNDEMALCEKAISLRSFELYADYVSRGFEYKKAHVYHNMAIFYETKFYEQSSAMKYYELCLRHGLGNNFKVCAHYWHFLENQQDERSRHYAEKCLEICNVEPENILKSRKRMNMLWRILRSYDNERWFRIHMINGEPYRYLTMLTEDAYENWSVLTKVHQLKVTNEHPDIVFNLRHYADIQRSIIVSCKTELICNVVKIILNVDRLNCVSL